MRIYPDSKDIPLFPQPLTPHHLPSPEPIHQRIFSIISRIFNSIKNCINRYISCAYFFKNKNITPLNQTHFPSPRPTLSESSTPLIEKEIQHISIKPPLQNTVLSPQKAEVIPYVSFDESIEKLRLSLREFVQQVIEVVHEQQIIPCIAIAQEAAPSIPPAIKSITKLIIEMGDKAAKPLFQKLAGQKAETIDPALKKILNMLLRIDTTEFRTQLFNQLENEIGTEALPKGQKALDYLKPVMDWICTSDQQKIPVYILQSNNDTLNRILLSKLCTKGLDFYHSYQLTDTNLLYASLEEKLTIEMKESSLPIDQEITKHYIRPILDWLLRSDQSEPIASMFVPKARYNENLIDHTFELAITYIVEHNIDQYASRLDDLLQNQLQKIVYNTIQANAQNITDFFTQRGAEIITAMPFTQTFDKIIHDVVAAHIETCAEAEAATTNSILREQAYLRQFSKSKACNLFTKQIIQQQILLSSQNKDPANAHKAIQKAFFSHLTENLFELMFSTKKTLTNEGEIEEIDPFMDLWQRLVFPEELYSLSQKIEEIIQEFVLLDMRSLLSTIKQPSLEIVRSIFKTTTQDILKKQLTNLLQNIFEKLTLPENIDTLMAEAILPAINKLLLQTIINKELSKNIRELLPHFLALINGDPQNRKSYIEAIQKVLITIVQKNFIELSQDKFHLVETLNTEIYSLSYESLSSEEWMALTLDIIEKNEQRLLKCLHENPHFSHSEPNEAELLTRYKKLLEKEDLQKEDLSTHTIYGELVFNLIFKLGEWPEYIGIGSVVQNLVNTLASEAINDVRSSHELLAKALSDLISENLTDKKKLFNLFYGPPSSDSPHGKEKLNHQIDTLAKLAYELILKSTEDQYKVIRFGIKKYLKEDSFAIKSLITDVYQKLLGRCIVNESVLMNFCECFFKGLNEGAEVLKQQQQLSLHLNV